MGIVGNPPFSNASPGEPVWETAELFPEQGAWTERQYLSLQTNRLVEFNNGTIEVLPAPTKTHQRVVLFLYEVLKAFITAHGLGGLVLVAPYRLRVPADKFREPDVLYLTAEQDARAGEEFTEAAEIVAEVVSPDDPDRDYVTKRADYAAAGVPEYWIIDYAARQVTVLRLDPAGQFIDHGRFSAGQQITSPRLPGFAVSIDGLLALGR